MTVAKLLLPLLAALGALSCRSGQGADPAILVLGDEVVRRSDFERYLAEVESRGGGPLPPEARRGLLDSFFEQRVLLIEARRRGLLTKGAYPEAEQPAVSELLSRAAPAGPVTEEEISAYYGAHVTELSVPETITLRQVLVATQNEARDVRRRLARESKDFEKIARAVSRGPEAQDGGLMGTFARGQLPAVLEAAAFPLAIGVTSEIVETTLGYHILRVEARQEARATSLSEAQDRIRTLLTREKSDRNARKFVDDLLAQAKVNHAAALLPPSS
jgi:peptidyl-prolyl cis-trans isomerase C